MICIFVNEYFGIVRFLIGKGCVANAAKLESIATTMI